ncbi:MAG: hypothetical protein V3U87_16165 [Methylococcaceae bacterium]
MNITGKQLLKILFSSSLIVAISSLKSTFSDKFIVLGSLSYFFLFLLAVFCLSLFELIVDWFAGSDLYKRIFFKDSYICGWWLNYAYTNDEKHINNFSLIHISKYKSKLYVDGMTFGVLKGDLGFTATERSSYKSRIAEYDARDRVLSFHFTIRDADDERIRGRFGYCDYNFVKNNNAHPTSFLGQFSLDSLNKFCRVKGHKIEGTKILKRLGGSVPGDRYKVVLEYGLDKKWFDVAQLR